MCRVVCMQVLGVLGASIFGVVGYGVAHNQHILKTQVSHQMNVNFHLLRRKYRSTRTK